MRVDQAFFPPTLKSESLEKRLKKAIYHIHEFVSLRCPQFRFTCRKCVLV